MYYKTPIQREVFKKYWQKEYLNIFGGCLEREIRRYFNEPIQTILNVVFQNIIFLILFFLLSPGKIQFIIPGMVVFTTFNIAISNTRMSLFVGRLEGSLYYQLSAPIPRIQLYFVYLIASGFRSAIINCILLIFCIIIFRLNVIYHFGLFIITFFLLNVTFINLGMLLALYAKNWNSVGAIDSYITSPLLYLSGTFFSLEYVPQIYNFFFYINPFFHFSNLTRYSFLGVYELNFWMSFWVCIFLFLVSTLTCLFFFKNGIRLLK